MSRQARRSKTRHIRWMKKQGYAYRRGRFWSRWKWTLELTVSEEVFLSLTGEEDD